MLRNSFSFFPSNFAVLSHSSSATLHKFSLVFGNPLKAIRFRNSISHLGVVGVGGARVGIGVGGAGVGIGVAGVTVGIGVGCAIGVGGATDGIGVGAGGTGTGASTLSPIAGVLSSPCVLTAGASSLVSTGPLEDSGWSASSMFTRCSVSLLLRCELAMYSCARVELYQPFSANAKFPSGILKE